MMYSRCMWILCFAAFLICAFASLLSNVVFAATPVPVITKTDCTGSPAACSNGTGLVIHGKNFGNKQGSTYVLFGTQKAQFNSKHKWSDSVIEVIIPPCNGQHDITGKVPIKVVVDGKTASNTVQFTYLSAPYISKITQLTGKDKNVTVRIDGKNFMSRTSGTSAVKFGEKTGKISAIGSSNIEAIAPSGIPKPVDIKVITSEGESNVIKFTYK